MSGKDGPTRRVLQVLRMVSFYGPITLSALCEKCAFSRAAIWRALDVLRAEGWVRMRLGDNAYVMREDCANQLQQGSIDYPFALDISTFMAKLADQFDVHVALVGFDDSDTFKIFESTDRADYADHSFSLVEDPAAVAAQLTVEKTRLVKILRIFLATCAYDERYAIESGQHAATLRTYQQSRVVWGNSHNMVAIPAQIAEQSGLAFAIRKKSDGVLTATVSDLVLNTHFG